MIKTLMVVLLAALPGLRVKLQHKQPGQVSCLLFSGDSGFPSDAERAVSRQWCAGSVCDFGVRAIGTYAVACFLDVNGNGVLDRGLLGIPSEPTVVSHHARGFMGPPSFEDAKFEFTGSLDLLLELERS